MADVDAAPPPPMPRAASKHSPVEEWNVDDVCERLASCVWAPPTFRHKVRLHRIDGRALTELTKDDLREDFGVTELGQIKSILRNIGNLRKGDPAHHAHGHGPKLHSLLAMGDADQKTVFWAQAESGHAGNATSPALDLLQELMITQPILSESPPSKPAAQKRPKHAAAHAAAAADTKIAVGKPPSADMKIVVGKPAGVRAMRKAEPPRAKPKHIARDPLEELFSEIPPTEPVVVARRPPPTAALFSDADRVTVSQNNTTLSGSVKQPLAPLKRAPPAPHGAAGTPPPVGSSAVTRDAGATVLGSSRAALYEVPDSGTPTRVSTHASSEALSPMSDTTPLDIPKRTPSLPAVAASPEVAVRSTIDSMTTLERHMVPYRPGILELERRFKEVEHLFEVWDTSSNISIEGSGYIEQAELREVLSHFYGWTEDEKGQQTNRIMQDIDLNGDGQLDRDEFHRYMSEMTWSKTPSEFDSLLKFLVRSVSEASQTAERERRRKAIIALFKAWDWDKSGSIDADELRTVVVRYNDWSHRQGKHSAALIMNERDENRDEQLDQSEFLDLYMQKTHHMMPDEFDFMVFRTQRCVQDLQEDQRVIDIDEFKPLAKEDLYEAWQRSGTNAPLILYGLSVDPAMQVERLGAELGVSVRAYLVQHEKSEKVALKELVRWGMGRGQWIYVTLHHSYPNLEPFLRQVGVQLRQRASYLIHRKFRLWVMVNTTRYIRLPEIIRLNAVPVPLDDIRVRRIAEYNARSSGGAAEAQPPPDEESESETDSEDGARSPEKHKERVSVSKLLFADAGSAAGGNASGNNSPRSPRSRHSGSSA